MPIQMADQSFQMNVVSMFCRLDQSVMHTEVVLVEIVVVTQATFTLSNITKDDERFYGCFIKPDDPNHATIVDFVHLFLVGMYPNEKAQKRECTF